MTKAYHITGWQERYEVTEKGAEAKPDTPIEKLKKYALRYIRLRVFGHRPGPSFREVMNKGYKKGLAMGWATWGVFCMLLEVAGDQEREYRGWILDHNQRPMDAEAIHKMFFGDDIDVVKRALEILCDPDIDWVELKEIPDFSGASQEFPGKSGASRQGHGTSPLNVNVTETVTETELNLNPTKTIPGKAGESDSFFNHQYPDFDSAPIFTVFLKTGLILDSIFKPKSELDKNTLKKLTQMVLDSIKSGRCERSFFQEMIQLAKECHAPGIKKPIAKFIVEMRDRGFKLRTKTPQEALS